VYWALGGSWFLATALNMDIERIPEPLVWVTWCFVGCMVVAALTAVWRVGMLPTPVPQPLLAFALWVCTVLLLAGAVFDFTIPRFWDRRVFAPFFLVLALLSFVLALPRRSG
jgi:hypothetical protein